MFPLDLDENAQDSVLVALRRSAGVDCMTSNEAENGGLSDERQLAFAASVGRAIVTLDKGDFQRLHGQWMANGRTHAGIVIVTSVWIPAQSVSNAVLRLQNDLRPEHMTSAIRYVSAR